MKKKETAIVYGILNKQVGKYYIGSSRHVKVRRKQHCLLLEEGNHSQKLQKAWDKSIPEDWEWIILEEEIPVIHQFHAEQHWIDKLNSFKNGYNANPRAGSYVMIDSRGYDWFVKKKKNDILAMIEMIRVKVPYRKIANKYGVSLGFVGNLKKKHEELLEDIIKEDIQKRKKAQELKAQKSLRKEHRAILAQKVIALAQKNVPYRKIAKITGCSLGTITNIKKTMSYP